jgi:hypothetical protein
MRAAILETYEDVQAATPGLYIVRSDSDAYFPALARLEAGEAKFRGESYDPEGRKMVVLSVTTRSGFGALGVDPGLRQMDLDPAYFLTVLKEYKDWEIKWWREAAQNSVDAGAQRVAFTAKENSDGTWTIAVEDNGSGMTEEILVTKFLRLGATTKVGAEGAAGGFGKAKELLLLPWITWRVHTRSIVAEGTGNRYSLQEAPYLHGTRVEVIMAADQHTSAAAAIAFIEKSYLPQVQFTVNGKTYDAALRGENLVGDIPGKAEFYFTPQQGVTNYNLYVRTRGLYMFDLYVGKIPGYVLVELTAPSIEILTANRDGFRDSDVKHAVSRLAEKIAKDNISALKSKRGLIRQKFEGTGKFRAKRLAAELLEQIGPTSDKLAPADLGQLLAVLVDFETHAPPQQKAALPSSATARVLLDQVFTGPSHIEAALKQLVWEPDFYIINDIEGFKVPAKLFPATMTPRVLKLAKTWVELVRYVMMQLGARREFGVGWILSGDIAAAAATTSSSEAEDWGISEGENWILLNPFRNMRGGEIWRPTNNTDLKWLYAAAVHECTHIADGISYHDESFARALTYNVAKTADGYRKIRKIVAGIRMAGGAELGAGYDDDDDDGDHGDHREDSNAYLQRIENAIYTGNDEVAHETCRYLSSHLARGGVEPMWSAFPDATARFRRFSETGR